MYGWGGGGGETGNSPGWVWYQCLSVVQVAFFGAVNKAKVKHGCMESGIMQMVSMHLWPHVWP